MAVETRSLFGAIEAGGTKFVCAVATIDGEILAEISLPTTTPSATFDRVGDFFAAAIADHGVLTAIGIGTFGPAYVRRDSPHYGHIANTPKPGWAGIDILGEIERRLGVRAILDTDVNCALRGELHAGAGVGYRDLVYLTIGTGIGGGVLVDGRIAYGFAHSEIGHMNVAKFAEDAAFAGACPFHRDRCIEGLASGPALQQRWGANPHNLPPSHPCWALQARYLATLCVNLLMVTAPRRIVLGGGVMQQTHLFAPLRVALGKQINNYVDFAANDLDLTQLIVPAVLGARAGIVGCIELAREFAASIVDAEVR